MYASKDSMWQRIWKILDFVVEVNKALQFGTGPQILPARPCEAVTIYLEFPWPFTEVVIRRADLH